MIFPTAQPQLFCRTVLPWVIPTLGTSLESRWVQWFVIPTWVGISPTFLGPPPLPWIDTKLEVGNAHPGFGEVLMVGITYLNKIRHNNWAVMRFPFGLTMTQCQLKVGITMWWWRSATSTEYVHISWYPGPNSQFDVSFNRSFQADFAQCKLSASCRCHMIAGWEGTIIPR